MIGPDLETLARGTIALGFPAQDWAAARAFAPGAVVLFSRNLGESDTATRIASLRAGASPPPLIAIDQEGGRVARLRAGVAQLPSAMAQGALFDPHLVERLGILLGRDLARLGISVDFAPVADLALEPAGAVIGTRAFGDDPHAVADNAAAFARGLERGGVAAALKHFPGHGATAADSHVGLPRIRVSAATLRARDLVPFARAITASAPSIVMTAHVVIEALDPERPATLSHAVLTGLLREELGFGGVVATDCLEMDAIAEGIGTARGAVEALSAGADLLLISHRRDRAEDAVAAIVAAVIAGRVPRSRLEEAYARVLRLRRRFAVLTPFGGALDDGAPLEAARRAVTVVRGDVRLHAGAPVTVLSFEGTLADNAARSGMKAGTIEAPSLSSALRRRRWKSEIMRVPLEPDVADLELLIEHIARLGEREFVIVTRRAHVHAAQREAVAQLIAVAPNALVVSAREPFDALLWPAARRIVCIYGDEALAFEGCADVLSGLADPRGRLPVNVSENAAVR